MIIICEYYINNIGRLFREPIFSEDTGSDYITGPAWMKASECYQITLLTHIDNIIITDTSASTVRADDPLLSMGEQTLYISPTSISHKKKIGEGEAISR